jgi:hypothetical protein
MRSKQALTVGILILSFLAPLQLTSPASADSADVLAKGQLVRPGDGGYPHAIFCPPAMAAVGFTITPGAEGILYDFRIECVDKKSLEKGSANYALYTKFFVAPDPRITNRRSAICPTGSVLSGLRLATTFYIQDVSPVCSSYETGVITADNKVGLSLSRPTSTASTCPVVNSSPTYVIGVQGYVGGGVDALGVLCGRTLKSNSQIELSSSAVLLAQYLPKGSISSNFYLQPSFIHPYVNFSSLTQIAGTGTTNTDVYPFRSGVAGENPFTRYMQFDVIPATRNITLSITSITYSSLSYAIGLGPLGDQISGKSANLLNVSTESTVKKGSFSTQITPGNGAQEIVIDRQTLSFLPIVSEATKVRMSFTGATGNQYNDLSSRNGATGLRIYGVVTDNSPVSPVVLKKPDAPTNFTFNIRGNTAVVTIDVPKALIGSVDRNSFALISPELGFIAGEKLIPSLIDKGKAYFKFEVKNFNLGKKVTFRIASIKDSVESAPLLKTIMIPNPATSTPKSKISATPKVTPKVVTPKAIKCTRLGITREFNASSCPPGYTKD